MADEHILVDGYSILHQWPEFRPLLRKSLAAARQALIHLMTQFQDCRGGKITVVFDGRSIPRGGDGIRTQVQIIYSKDGQTADAVIERLVGQSAHPQQFLVATDDYAEQNLVESCGAHSLSADGFHALVQAELDSLDKALEGLALRNQSFGRRRSN